jgi:Transglutaminase-like superfamily
MTPIRQAISGRILTIACLCLFSPAVRGEEPEWHLVYTPNHRAAFEEQWTYHFPNYNANHWTIALRYPPELLWSREAEGKAELLTSEGWRPFGEIRDQSRERRRMLIIHAQDDPKLRHGFTVRTTLTATICDQRLVKGPPEHPVAPLTPAAREAYLSATDTFDFHKAIVKKWMDDNHLWKRPNESRLDFVHRVYKQLRMHLPYSTADGGRWVCSQILKVGFGECCRHGIVGTSILRANHIPARTVCGVWAIDPKSEGGHCWGEFFMDGVGWVPYDTTLGDDKASDGYFGRKTGEVLAGMVDFDWTFNAGTFGRQTVFAIDAFPGYWSHGKGDLNNPKVDTHTKVWVVKKMR